VILDDVRDNFSLDYFTIAGVRVTIQSLFNFRIRILRGLFTMPQSIPVNKQSSRILLIFFCHLSILKINA